MKTERPRKLDVSSDQLESFDNYVILDLVTGRLDDMCSW